MESQEQQIAEMADLFEENRSRLRSLAILHMPQLLARRLSPEDLLQETWLAALRRKEAFYKTPEIPPFIRFRSLLLQTLVDLERKYLLCQKRDASKDEEYDAPDDHQENGMMNRWNFLTDTMTSPRTQLAKKERFHLVRQTLKQLSEADRTIIEMRNFENLTNLECATALSIDPKAASIRYIRALKRFREILNEMTEFRL